MNKKVLVTFVTAMFVGFCISTMVMEAQEASTGPPVRVH